MLTKRERTHGKWHFLTRTKYASAQRHPQSAFRRPTADSKSRCVSLIGGRRQGYLEHENRLQRHRAILAAVNLSTSL